MATAGPSGSVDPQCPAIAQAAFGRLRLAVAHRQRLVAALEPGIGDARCIEALRS